MRRYYFHEAFWLSSHQAGGELLRVFAFHRMVICSDMGTGMIIGSAPEVSAIGKFKLPVSTLAELGDLPQHKSDGRNSR